MKKGIIISLLAAASLWAQQDPGAPGTLKWRYQTGDIIVSSPAIGSDGAIYFGSNDDYFYALYPNGNLKWRFKAGDDVSSSPAIGSDGMIYFGSDDGYYYALNPDGTLKWKYKTEGELLWPSPAIGLDGTIYVGSWTASRRGHYLYSLNPDGTLKWRYHHWVMACPSSPALDSDGTIYFGSINYLYALNSNGTLKWKYSIESTSLCPPAIGSDRTIYVGSFDNYLYALNPDGSLKWRYKTGDTLAFSSASIGLDGTVYVGSYDNNLYALNSNGTLKWRYKTGGKVISSPAIGSDGTIYFESNDSYLYALTSHGTVKWCYSIGDSVVSSPAIGVDGTIYFGSHDGYLYAIHGGSRGLANSPWPKFNHDNQNTGRAEGGEAIVAAPTSPTTTPTTAPTVKPIFPPAPPELAFTVETSDTDADGIFEGGESVSLTVSITNSGEGVAEGVTVSLSGPDVLLGRIGSSKTITSIGPGETKSARFSALLPYDVESQNVEVRVTLSASQLGKIPQEKLLQVAIAPAPTKVEREVVSRIVDVDQVPSRRTTNENAYAVVIGIEEYREEGIPSVDYALSDAEKVREYLINVVGIRADHIFTLLNDRATTSDIAGHLEDRLPRVVDRNSLVFIYYAGHGTQDAAGNPYLVPYNGQLNLNRSLYSLTDFNQALSVLPTDNVVVALDACYSGGGRSALAPGRPVIMTKKPEVGKGVVLAAADSNQTANPYDAAEHGLFTYYLLKALKGEGDTDSDGWVELGELYEFVEENVSKTAARVLFKEQTPTVIPGDMGGKENLKIGKAR